MLQRVTVTLSQACRVLRFSCEHPLKKEERKHEDGQGFGTVGVPGVGGIGDWGGLGSPGTLAKPILAVVALFNFMAPMTDFLLPQIVLTSPEHKTLAVGLFGMINQQFGKNFTTFAAGAVLIAVPIAAVYLALQRAFISGLTAGGTKS
jgi:ABC-type maltose transport systems, permease component